ncbi:hypothetical protein [Flexistipes sp.]|uniref:hypothetical protein n=1 Tax=Flexistipes sp. TaxID=3088135 RepID=UPI002E1E0E9F|nr:hypothetical protein [Flexistipes sp.]
MGKMKMGRMIIDRTSSMGLWRYANEFYESARLIRNIKGKLFVPSYYLICHSIELALKAFLRGCGKELDFLKNVLGHDLKKCLDEARNNNLSEYVKISSKFETSIEVVNPYYMSKQFEYITSGIKTLPDIDDIDILIEGTSQIIKDIKKFCVEKRKLHYKTDSADK